DLGAGGAHNREPERTRVGWQHSAASPFVRIIPMRAIFCASRLSPPREVSMHSFARAALFTASCAAPVVAQQGATPRAFQLADWYKLTTLSSPAMSPAGDRVAFTVTTVREAENKRHNEVWVVPTAGGEPQRYTSPSTESSSP